MCIITATAVAAATGLSVAAASAAAGTAAVSAAGVIAGVANTLLVAGVVGTALGTVGNYQAKKAEAKTHAYNAQVAEENRKIALNNAAMERQAGLEEARRQRIATLQAIGKQEVALAANGVDVGYGTSLDLIEDTATMGELDALMIEYDAEKKARNYEIQANNFANEANLATFASRNANSAAKIEAVAGTLKTAGQIGNMMSAGLGGAGKLDSGATIIQKGKNIKVPLSSGLA